MEELSVLANTCLTYREAARGTRDKTKVFDHASSFVNVTMLKLTMPTRASLNITNGKLKGSFKLVIHT